MKFTSKIIKWFKEAFRTNDPVVTSRYEAIIRYNGAIIGRAWGVYVVEKRYAHPDGSPVQPSTFIISTAKFRLAWILSLLQTEGYEGCEDLLGNGQLSMGIVDVTTGEVIVNLDSVIFISGNWSLDNRGVHGEDTEFIGTREG